MFAAGRLRFPLVSAATRALSSSLLPDGLLPPVAPITKAGRGAGRDTLGRRLLTLIYPKRSAVVVLRKWAEEGKTIQKYQLNRVVRELRKYKRYKHGLEVRHVLLLLFLIFPFPFDFRCLIFEIFSLGLILLKDVVGVMNR